MKGTQHIRTEHSVPAHFNRDHQIDLTPSKSGAVSQRSFQIRMHLNVSSRCRLWIEKLIHLAFYNLRVLAVIIAIFDICCMVLVNTFIYNTMQYKRTAIIKWNNNNKNIKNMARQLKPKLQLQTEWKKTKIYKTTAAHGWDDPYRRNRNETIFKFCKIIVHIKRLPGHSLRIFSFGQHHAANKFKNLIRGDIRKFYSGFSVSVSHIFLSSLLWAPHPRSSLYFLFLRILLIPLYRLFYFICFAFCCWDFFFVYLSCSFLFAFVVTLNCHAESKRDCNWSWT